jgi:hypothetical protein
MKNSLPSRQPHKQTGLNKPPKDSSEPSNNFESKAESNEEQKMQKGKVKSNIKPFPRPAVKARHYRTVKE